MAEFPPRYPFIAGDIYMKIETSYKSKTELNTWREKERNKKEQIYTLIVATPHT
jgi:hypothetical protein